VCSEDVSMVKGKHGVCRRFLRTSAGFMDIDEVKQPACSWICERSGRGTVMPCSFHQEDSLGLETGRRGRKISLHSGAWVRTSGASFPPQGGREKRREGGLAVFIFETMSRAQ